VKVFIQGHVQQQAKKVRVVVLYDLNMQYHGSLMSWEQVLPWLLRTVHPSLLFAVRPKQLV
jgi:hypothetical protein